jgi:hypothetical protein
MSGVHAARIQSAGGKVGGTATMSGVHAARPVPEAVDYAAFSNVVEKREDDADNVLLRVRAGDSV